MRREQVETALAEMKATGKTRRQALEFVRNNYPTTQDDCLALVNVHWPFVVNVKHGKAAQRKKNIENTGRY